jgi:hypothetical protein
VSSSDETRPPEPGPDDEVTRSVDWSQQWALPPADPQQAEWLRPAGSPWQPPAAIPPRPAAPPPPVQQIPPPWQELKPPAPPRPPRKARAERQPRPGLARGLIATAAAVVLAGGATGAVFLARSQILPTPARSGSASQSAPAVPPVATSTAPRVDIATRAGDPRPFTATELFPKTTETVGGRTYRLLASEVLPTCRTGATGAAATTLEQRGCSQVVRGTWVDSAERYVITVGLANLPTTAAAQQVIAVLRDPSQGAFLPYPVPGGVAATFDGHDPTVVGWQAQGHYLVYSVAALAGGKASTVSDPQLRQATADLRGIVGKSLLRRAVGR